MRNLFNHNASSLGVSLSIHAAIRQQQRGISNELVDLILKYGKTKYVREGVCYFLDNNTKDLPKDKAQKFCDNLSKCPYLVISGGVIVTTGWRDERIEDNYRPWQAKQRKKNRMLS